MRPAISAVTSGIMTIVWVGLGLGCGVAAGIIGGVASLFTGSKNLVYILGPILPIAIFIPTRKWEPFFAYPMLIGAAVGLWGMNACAHWSFNGGSGN
jgi:hypothetical protein